jgi:hypothetical protein
MRGQGDPDRDPWHPDVDAPASVRQVLVAEAVAVCAACPVQVQCGRYGIEMLATDWVVAVYGGMTPDLMRDMARRLGRPTEKEAQHGTRSRYVKGCRCQACRRANASSEVARRAAKRPQRRDCPALAHGRSLCRQPAQDGSIFCAAHAIPKTSANGDVGTAPGVPEALTPVYA